ncbi:uncharacterized protein KY384_002958 [Bacidia gigantensis]|uniref:uncharacterized protein n=1 Tax=Bacidia gigantensis TaxID=2732470 RepID=UPI001D0537EF|nr:uncharacterized protein KY384_002958 [Bacidia gigantensis]KAG8531329.1 hypothetical protein KY384_002958 [Bacidia gigantensis]
MGNTNSTPAPESEPASPPRSPTPPRAPTLPIPRMAPMPAMPEMPQTSPIPNTPSPNEHRQRNTVITTTHEAVRGTYTLSDSLSITTLSGSINITITLDPSQLSNPNITYSPHLTLKSTSGSIRVTMKDALPNSSTHLLLSTNLKTISGDIIATMPHSSETTILTTSGNVSAHLFTSLLTPREIKSHMGIETMSGDVHYTLSGPPGCKCDFGAAFDIQSRIRTVSGGVEYLSDERNIHAMSTHFNEVAGHSASLRVVCFL